MTSDPADELIVGLRTVTATLAAAARSLDREPAPPPTERIPVTLLTGFLGSGKTTVLRHLLTADHGIRLTAVVNDLGPINVDAALLGSPDERLALTNGCACCTLGDELVESLLAAAGSEPPPEAIVVEASGGADAVAMAATVEAEPGLDLDGIVCVVDGERVEDQLAHPVLGRLVRRQIEAAHLVLLSKVDLLDPGSVAERVGYVADVAPGRQVVPIGGGIVEPAVVLGAALLGAALRPRSEGHRIDLATAAVPLPDPLDIDRLTAWLTAPDRGLLRAKGWVLGSDGVTYELQLVGRRWALLASSDRREPALVLIAEQEPAVEEAGRALRSMT